MLSITPRTTLNIPTKIFLSCLKLAILVLSVKAFAITNSAPLFSASEKGDVEKIQQAIDSGINVDSFDADGWTPLMVAARNGKLAAVSTLLKAGADVNAMSFKGQTPLIASAISDNPSIVKLLLDSGADPDTTNLEGETALDVAKHTGKKSVIELLTKVSKPVETNTENTAATLRPADPKGIGAKIKNAADTFKAGDYQHAAKLFREITTLSPRDALVWHFLGQSLEKSGNLIDARKAYQRSSDIEPTSKLSQRNQTFLSKMPFPDPGSIKITSGLTLANWMSLSIKRSPSEVFEVLSDASDYIQVYGRIPELVELQRIFINNAISKIKVTSATSAMTALPYVMRLQVIAPESESVVHLEAFTNHFLGNMGIAVRNYSHWLQLAEPYDPLRAMMAANMVRAQKGLPPTLLSENEEEVAAQGPKTGTVFRDCPDCPEMVIIPSGSFNMGSNSKIMTSSNPVHRVTINYMFAIGRTEVTQAQWMAVMGYNPSEFQNCGNNCSPVVITMRKREHKDPSYFEKFNDAYPVDSISWDDAQKFILKLNAITGKQYRLPSEAEWEYACRAGEQQDYCGSNYASSVAWYGYEKSGKTTHQVASKKSNAFGLYDMSGNVSEWVEDRWHDNYDGAPNDGNVWQGGGAKRVLRGGDYVNADYELPGSVRADSRSSLVPHIGIRAGFRLVRILQ